MLLTAATKAGQWRCVRSFHKAGWKPQRARLPAELGEVDCPAGEIGGGRRAGKRRLRGKENLQRIGLAPIAIMLRLVAAALRRFALGALADASRQDLGAQAVDLVAQLLGYDLDVDRAAYRRHLRKRFGR